MSTEVRLRRGTTAQHATFTGASAEVTVDTDKKTLVVHDGATPGGVPLAKQSSVDAALNLKADTSALSAKADVTYVDSALSSKAGGVRNTVLIGDNVGGSPSFLTTGSGLTPAFTVSSTPLTITFADGFGTGGARDVLTRLTAGASLVAIAASCISYIAATYVDAANVTWSATKAPPQYGATYNRAAQSCLKLNNNALDDFGNSWTFNGGYSNSSPLFSGAYHATFNGSSQLAQTSDITTLYPPNSGGGWTMRAKARPAAFSGTVFCAGNAASYGAQVFVNPSGKLGIWLSSTGSSWDIANGVAGSTVIATGTSYDIELCYDPVAGKYILYLNGTQEISITSASRICAVTQVIVGAAWNGSAYFNFFNGAIGGFEFASFCRHPNGVAFTVPTTLPDITAAGYASDWYDTIAQQMKSVSAASGASDSNPTFTTSKKVYVGEATAGASSISSVTAYAFNQTGKGGSGLLNAFGYGQGYKDLTATSALNTRYVNTGPKPKAVSIQVGVSSGAQTMFAYVAQPGGPDKIADRASSWAGYSTANLRFIVPPGCSMRVAPDTGTWSIIYWGELDVL